MFKLSLLEILQRRGQELDETFLITESGDLSFRDLSQQSDKHLDKINQGDVVALIGDFDKKSIADLFTLLERKAVIVPLTSLTKRDHEYFFDIAQVEWVVEQGVVNRRYNNQNHPLIEEIKFRGDGGLVLFSTGTTGRPKAILHSMNLFLERFKTPRPTLRTIGFLLFDHIGGINTLLHTVFNGGKLISIQDRSPENVLNACAENGVELLPTTPTFLRMLLLSDLIPDKIPSSLKIITYGTERMDQVTLTKLCRLLPNIDFRQTYGMSELGILRVKSISRDSLFMEIGGEGVEIQVVNGILEIRSPTRMLGYLNASTPFDDKGWYNTGDMVIQNKESIKIVGRNSEAVNVGGLKFMVSEVEAVALTHEGVDFAVATKKENPITGEHVEIRIQLNSNADVEKSELMRFLKSNLPSHMWPARITIGEIQLSHRFKKV